MSGIEELPPLTKEARDMYKMVCALMSRRESEAFHEPVDWKGMGLKDYLEIVKNPIDLGTIKKNIEDRKYQTAEEIAQDIRLVWYNCMLYNRDGSTYYHLANIFAQGFEEAYAAYRKLEDISKDPNRIPTLDEKIQLSYDIFKLPNAELAYVLTRIEREHPQAIAKCIAQDEILVNFDALPGKLFHEINGFVLTCVKDNATNPPRRGGQKRKSTGVQE